MKQVQALLLGGEGEAARKRLSSLLREYPDKSEAAADAAGRLLNAAYDQFHVKAVHDFARGMELDLPAAVSEPLLRLLGPRFERTIHCQQVLHGVTRERLGRECRALLVTHKPREAAARALSLFEQARSDAEYEQNCIYLANALAELHRDRAQIQAMVQQVSIAPGM